MRAQDWLDSCTPSYMGTICTACENQNTVGLHVLVGMYFDEVELRQVCVCEVLRWSQSCACSMVDARTAPTRLRRPLVRCASLYLHLAVAAAPH